MAIRPGIRQRYSVAQAAYSRTRDVWRLYWRKCDHKWHGYTPLPETSDLARVLQESDTPESNGHRPDNASAPADS